MATVKRSYFRVTVKGRGSFPIDMLRYDGLHPQHESDSHAIARTHETEVRAERVPIELAGWHEKHWVPTEGRWRSFGWEVLSVDRAAD